MNPLSWPLPFLPAVIQLMAMNLNEIAARASTESGMIEIVAEGTGEGTTQAALEQALARLAAEPGLARVRWGPIGVG